LVKECTDIKINFILGVLGLLPLHKLKITCEAPLWPEQDSVDLMPEGCQDMKRNMVEVP
jgi:hypothetical protein